MYVCMYVCVSVCVCVGGGSEIHMTLTVLLYASDPGPDMSATVQAFRAEYYL